MRLVGLGWEEGGQSQESNQTYNQWNMMGQFIVVGSILQVDVLMNEMVISKARKSGWRVLHTQETNCRWY
jgi:hypothetical protein